LYLILAIKATNIANGVITTVAGTVESFGFSGDGGLATNARLNYPHGVFGDTLGNMYIADLSNHVVRKVDVNGVITTVAGTGGSAGFSGDGGLATNARLNYPAGVFVDTSGNMYIPDAWNHVIRKVTLPTVVPTAMPTLVPTYVKPSLSPTKAAKATRHPSLKPSFKPTSRPSRRPTVAPSPQPRTKAPNTDKPTRKNKG
jgi:hypothetical protein